MENVPPAELLQQLLYACNDGIREALRLAAQTEDEALRTFLLDSAAAYRRAAAEIAALVGTDVLDDRHLGRRHLSMVEFGNDGNDIAARWEHIECRALTYFRDAYDQSLPRPADETVRRHFELGVARLESLRRLQAAPA